MKRYLTLSLLLLFASLLSDDASSLKTLPFFVRSSVVPLSLVLSPCLSIPFISFFRLFLCTFHLCLYPPACFFSLPPSVSSLSHLHLVKGLLISKQGTPLTSKTLELCVSSPTCTLNGLPTPSSVLKTRNLCL